MLRTAMFLAAVGFTLYDWRVVWPKITLFREQYIAHADEPDVANPAKDEFDRYQRENLLLLMITVSVLAAMVLFSGNISSAVTFSITP